MTEPEERRAQEHELLEELKAHATPFEYKLFGYRRHLGWALFFIAFVAGVGLVWQPGQGRFRVIIVADDAAGMQAASTIGGALHAYAKDHGGKYPEGKSSTEVFQKLVDDGYITDASIFYLPMSGKSRAAGKVLKPENVCWDFTAGTRPDDPSNVAVVFSTGTQVDYARGKKAHVSADAPFGGKGVAVYFANEVDAFLLAQNGELSVNDLSYNPKAEHYVQLTP
jgi:hypothetical protein